MLEDKNTSKRRNCNNNEPQSLVESPRTPGILHRVHREPSNKEIRSLTDSISISSYLRIHGHRVYYDEPLYVLNCPFHHDTACNFEIIHDRVARCKVCGWEGDIIDFVQKRNQVSTEEAFYLLEKDAWLANKSAKGYIWNAKAAEHADTVQLFSSEMIASCHVRHGSDIKNQCASIAVPWYPDVSTELSKLLEGKSVMICMGPHESNVIESLADMLDGCKSVEW